MPAARRLVVNVSAFAIAAAAWQPGARAAEPDPAPARELECLVAAIAYEAGREPAEGQAAVARVVLNRVAHPAFPKTVCGVVYQGSTRRTGCQFTFTCDGSLARRLPAALWEGARAVAEAALAGIGGDAVGIGPGGATHYHATYVKPYWAPSLAEVATIGLHRFYRSGRGEPAAAPPVAGVAAVPQPGRFTVWGLTAAIVLPPK